MIFTTREKEEPLKEQDSPGKTKAGSDNSDYDLWYSYYRNRTNNITMFINSCLENNVPPKVTSK